MDETFRSQLQSLDRQLLELIDQRSAVLDAWQKNRKSEGEKPLSFAECMTRGDGREGDDSLRRLLHQVTDTSRHLCQWTERVSFLGPLYGFSHLAATRHFGAANEFVPVASIGAVFEEVSRDQSRWGVVPIENTTDGRIIDTLSLFAKYSLKIYAEAIVPISHCLLGRGARSEIREIYSKPQAISQCRDWLMHHMPEAKCIEIGSTATAARLASEKSGAAAIASREAAAPYGLEVIECNIQDRLHNATRFAVISHRDAEPTGSDKTSILFRVSHEPGALADAILIFRQREINLNWIESFPVPEVPNLYQFYVELEGHRLSPRVAECITALQDATSTLQILGSFPRASSLP